MLNSLKIITTSNIKTNFPSEIEENGLLSFLGITVSRENKNKLTSVHRKRTFSEVFINFESFIPDMHDIPDS